METQSEELERESQKVRARLSQTLDELHARMTPGQVVDQLTDYARHGPAADFFHNLAREVRENPLPLCLIATGVAWLIIASSLSARARAQHCATREASDICNSATAAVRADAEMSGEPGWRIAPATQKTYEQR